MKLNGHAVIAALVTFGALIVAAAIWAQGDDKSLAVVVAALAPTTLQLSGLLKASEISGRLNGELDGRIKAAAKDAVREALEEWTKPPH